MCKIKKHGKIVFDTLKIQRLLLYFLSRESSGYSGRAINNPPDRQQAVRPERQSENNPIWATMRQWAEVGKERRSSNDNTFIISSLVVIPGRVQERAFRCPPQEPGHHHRLAVAWVMIETDVEASRGRMTLIKTFCPTFLLVPPTLAQPSRIEQRERWWWWWW